MESKALQELVSTVSHDEKIRTQFIANPVSVFSRFNLTEGERRAVLATHARLKLATGSMELEAIDPLGIWNSPIPLTKNQDPTGIWNSPTS